jgi:hypothetical protein
MIKGFSGFVFLWLFSGPILFVFGTAEISPDFVTGFHPSKSNVPLFKGHGKSANGVLVYPPTVVRVVGRHDIILAPWLHKAKRAKEPAAVANGLGRQR